MKRRRFLQVALLGATLLGPTYALAEIPFYRAIALRSGGATLTLDKDTSNVIGYKDQDGRAILYSIYPKLRQITEIGYASASLPDVAISGNKITSLTRALQGFIYENGTFQFLPKLRPTDTQTYPMALNSTEVVGTSGTGNGIGPNTPVVWMLRHDGAYDVMELPITATTINSKGDIAGNNNSGQRAVLFQNGALLTFGSSYFRVSDINNNTQIVGSFWQQDHYTAFVWNPLSGVIILPPLGNFLNSIAVGINDEGFIVGSSWTEGSYEVTIWDNGIPFALGAQSPEGKVLKYALGINNLGQILVTTTNSEAFLLTPTMRSAHRR